MKKGILISTLSLMALTIVGCTKSQNQSQENGCNEVAPSANPSNPTVEPDNPANPTNPTNKVTVQVYMNGGRYDGEEYHSFSVRPGTLWRAAKVNIDTSKITYDQYHTFKLFSLKPYEDDEITDSYVVKENFTAYVRYNVVIPPEDQCKVKWLNSDDTELTQSEIYGKGETPVYKGPDPEHPIVPGHTFQFIGWNPKIAPLTGGDVTYRAQYFDITAEHTVTFDYQYDNIKKGVTVKDGDKVSSFTPERYGYSFTGWYNTSECTAGDLFNFEQSITNDVTIYAGWNQNTRIVTFNHLDKDTDPTVTTVTVNYGEKVKFFEPTREHYAFVEWQYDDVESGTRKKFDFDTAIVENIDLYATWEALDYTITFNPNGGNYVAPISKPYNTQVELPTPAWEGHTFTEWQLNGQGVTSPYTIVSNVTLDAVWSQNTCDVVFDWGYGDEPHVETVTVNYGERVTPLTPTWEGHSFKHWKDKKTNEPFDFTTLIKEKVELIAIWDTDTYTVTFSANGGYFPINEEPTTSITKTVDYNDTISNDDVKNPEYNNYDFMGWFDESGAQFTLSSEEPPVEGTHVIKNWTVYAKWERKASHTVKFLVDGAQYGETQTIPYGDKALRPAVDPSKPGHKFLGWYNGSDTNSFDFSTPIYQNYELNAKFSEAEQFTVTFISNGGSAVPTQTIAYGGKVEEPEDPTYDGYTFGGWFDNSACTGETYNFNTEVTKSFNLYAKWNPVADLTVKFMDGDTELSTQTVKYGDKAIRPENPAPKGDLPFDNWYTSTGYTEVFNFGNPIKTNTSIYAHWAAHADKLTVNFDPKGGTFVSSITVPYDGRIATSPTTTREGYTFNGWWIDNTTPFEFGESSGTQVRSNQTLFAKWNIVTTYKVQFNANGGKWSDESITKEVQANFGAYPSVETPTNGIMVFTGWKRASDEGIGIVPIDVPAQGDTYSEIYTAQWKQGGYTYHTVTFDSAGGSTVVEQHVKEGEHAIKPADPIKKGSTFKNWYLDGQSATTVFDFDNTTIMGPITLHANWDNNVSYTVTWYNEDGTIFETQDTYKYNDDLILPESVPAPKFDGNDRLMFSRWSPNTEGVKVTENRNFYAVYKVNNDINFSFSSQQYTIDGEPSFEEVFTYGDEIRFTFDAAAPSTVTVKVDGVTVTTGYTYNPTTGVISINTMDVDIRNAKTISLGA